MLPFLPPLPKKKCGDLVRGKLLTRRFCNSVRNTSADLTIKIAGIEATDASETRENSFNHLTLAAPSLTWRNSHRRFSGTKWEKRRALPCCDVTIFQLITCLCRKITCLTLTAGQHGRNARAIRCLCCVLRRTFWNFRGTDQPLWCCSQLYSVPAERGERRAFWWVKH